MENLSSEPIRMEGLNMLRSIDGLRRDFDVHHGEGSCHHRLSARLRHQSQDTLVCS